MESFLIWLAATVVLAAAIVIGRGSRLTRSLRLSDLDWKAVVVFSAVIGLIPAFVFSQIAPAEVTVPEGVGENPVLVTEKPADK